MRLGFDFRRIHADSIGGGGDLGSFTFSGFATENPLLQTCNPATDAQGARIPSGSSMADFLIGVPQQSNVTAGLNKIYLRGNAWDWYAQDDWRARAEPHAQLRPALGVLLALLGEVQPPRQPECDRRRQHAGRVHGVRYGGARLDLRPAVCAAVQPGTLVKPDKAMYSPRVSIAWQPKFKFTKKHGGAVQLRHQLQHRPVLAASPRNLAFQQPFSVTQKNVQSTPGHHHRLHAGEHDAELTASTAPRQVTQSSFGVNPNYRLGMVQVYNFGIQRTLPQGIVLNIDYTGAYAGNLDMRARSQPHALPA